MNVESSLQLTVIVPVISKLSKVILENEYPDWNVIEQIEDVLQYLIREPPLSSIIKFVEMNIVVPVAYTFKLSSLKN